MFEPHPSGSNRGEVSATPGVFHLLPDKSGGLFTKFGHLWEVFVVLQQVVHQGVDVTRFFGLKNEDTFQVQREMRIGISGEVYFNRKADTYFQTVVGWPGYSWQSPS